MAEERAVTPAEPPREPRRRRWRELTIIGVTALAVLVYAVLETRIPQVAGGSSFATDAMLVLLININLILLVLLVFLVGRQVFKLVLDRRRGTLGSHLRTRLVLAFAAIALLPTTLLLIVAQTFTTNSIERWFNREVDRALKGSLEVAHAYYQEVASTSLGFSRRIADRLAREPALLHPAAKRQLRPLLNGFRHEYQLDVVEVFAAGHRLARSRNPALRGRLGTDVRAKVVQDASMGTAGAVVDSVDDRDVVRAAAPVLSDERVIAVVVVDAYIPGGVAQRRAGLDRSFSEYLSLKIQRKPIRTAYTITLVLVTLVVVFTAVWLAFYVARGITVPIQQLAEGTRRVAQGDLDHRIDGGGDDEIGTLVQAFNGMTSDLKASRVERDARRRDLETVLANVTGGVIASDAAGHIGTINPAAAMMLGLDVAATQGRSLAEVFAAPGLDEVGKVIQELLVETTTGLPDDPVERHVTVEHEGRSVALLVTGTRLFDHEGAMQGLVLFFEDVTHLMRVERMEAWREVARRIAHEIKNPLTPIQLSAQRLRRRYRDRLGDDAGVLEECTRTIEHEVEALKTLVNEFATFARLPTSDLALQDLHAVLDEVVVLFREAHPDVHFTLTHGVGVPWVELDREGIRRVLVNLLDNAVAAVRDMPAGEERRITVETSWDQALQTVRVEIMDNGPGIAPELRGRLFEPYVSTKPEGTGLGLAIVSAIMTDHKGFVRVRESFPRGSRFVLEFPVRQPVHQTVRRVGWGGA
jgi:two-component system nitrogen regulation sensor histidine kinase NtrY